MPRKSKKNGGVSGQGNVAQKDEAVELMRKQEAQKKKEWVDGAQGRADKLWEIVQDKVFFGTGSAQIDIGIVSDKAAMIRCKNLRRRIKKGDLIMIDCASEPKEDTVCVVIKDNDYRLAIMEEIKGEDDLKLVDMTVMDSGDDFSDNEDGTMSIKREDYIGTISFVLSNPYNQNNRYVKKEPVAHEAKKANADGNEKMEMPQETVKNEPAEDIGFLGSVL